MLRPTGFSAVHMSMEIVKAWAAPVTLPTHEPHAPDKNPMFLETRVYQGSSGKVYPQPFTDRIADEPCDRHLAGGATLRTSTCD